MKINLKLEILKVFLMDFNWETGKKLPSQTGDTFEKQITIDTPSLTDQTQQDAK